MQTFLPYADFTMSAAALDNSRLGNQCYRECKTLLNGGWRHHPASKMWQGHKGALCSYALALVDEMETRGRWKVEVIDRWRRFFQTRREGLDRALPAWLGDERIHASHRSSLLRKDPSWYGQFGWTETPGLPYVWPV